MKRLLLIFFTFILIGEYISIIIVMIYTDFGNRMALIIFIEIIIAILVLVSDSLYDCYK